MAATATTTIRCKPSSSTMMLCSTVIIAIIANLVLSVDAIKCHQCNSHLDEDCIGLRLSTPRHAIDDQYLKECDGGENAFCRKTVLTIEVTGEHRIVRSCGYDDADLRQRKISCFDADEEGLLQTICACETDGCNAAPGSQANSNKFAVLALAGVCILLATLLRRSG